MEPKINRLSVHNVTGKKARGYFGKGDIENKLGNGKK